MDDVAKFSAVRGDIDTKYAALVGRYSVRLYRNEQAREFGVHGFCRRLGTLVRAIDVVYDALPPELEDIPERNAVVDATIAIQSFVVNIFGCLDNLARIWVCERGVKNKDGTDLDRMHVGLGIRNREVRRSLSDKFRAYLENYSEWFDHIKDWRDALAHRIPLYIPPYIVSPGKFDEFNRLVRMSGEALRRGDMVEYEALQTEQMALGVFRPWMLHSLYESGPGVVFHSQLLCDYLLIDEFGRKMLDELDR